MLTSKQLKMISILILVILNIIIYWQVQNHTFINYDDPLYVTSNDRVQLGITLKSIFSTFTEIQAANWHPLTMLSHMLDWELYGENAGGHHWTNLIFHIINTVLLFLLLNQMTGAIWRSALVAALFAIHPINVESVAWVAERKNVLSTFFWILTMLFYVRYVWQPGWKRYLPVLACFALGLMSKPMLVTLPFVLLLMDYWPLNRTAIDTKNENRVEIQTSLQPGKEKLSFLILEKTPLLVLTVISICVTLYAQHSAGAMVSTDSLPLSQRMINAIFSYGMYIKKMFWPLDLSVFYPQYNMEFVKLFVVSFLLILITSLVLRYYRKRPYLLVGWFWYLGTLVPVIGIVQVGSQAMADRYAYVPFVGLFIMLVWSVAEVAKKNKYITYIIALTSILIISVLLVISWQRCQLWGDARALWIDVVKHHNVAFAYNLRGLSYAETNQYKLALADYDSAIALKKKFAEAFSNRGNLYVAIGQYDKALKDYNEAQRLKPKFADAYYNRGVLYLKTLQLDKAILDFTNAINIDSKNADYYHNRGVALGLKGKHEKSFADFNSALSLNPNLSEAYFNRGIIYQLHKQYLPAIINFTEALNIKPEYVDALFRRGVSLTFLGKYDQAIKDFTYVLRLDSKNISALNNLGLVLQKMGRYEESAEQYRKILQIKPGDHKAREQLKEIANLERKGKPDTKE